MRNLKRKEWYIYICRYKIIISYLSLHFTPQLHDLGNLLHVSKLASLFLQLNGFLQVGELTSWHSFWLAKPETLGSTLFSWHSFWFAKPETLGSTLFFSGHWNIWNILYILYYFNLIFQWLFGHIKKNLLCLIFSIYTDLILLTYASFSHTELGLKLSLNSIF